jgi:transposase
MRRDPVSGIVAEADALAEQRVTGAQHQEHNSGRSSRRHGGANTGPGLWEDRRLRAAARRVADRVRPTPRPLPDAVVQQLDALMTRRRQLLDMLTAERNRLEHAVGPIRRSLVDHIRWLERRVAAVDRDLDDTIARSPVWRAKRISCVACRAWGRS